MYMKGIRYGLLLSNRPALVCYVCLLGYLIASPVARAQTTCPAIPVVSLSSPDVPTDVCIPANFGGNPIAFFDDFSWKSFIAMVWPAESGQRGEPDRNQSVTGKGPRVFDTYKAMWEVFHNDGSPPLPWNSPDNMNACAAMTGFGDLVLASFSKFGDLGQAGFGSLIGPLVAQNTTYVRYLTGFNKVEFEQIALQKLYLRDNLPHGSETLTFRNGSLDVKSAWIDISNFENPERYYTRTALVLDPMTGSCTKKTVGLVGLHIVQKTPSRPQWIWSTFEQIDNVPQAQSAAGRRFTFNNGDGKPMPGANPYPISPLKLPTPPPFNVERLKPIHSSTQATNDKYQAALKSTNSVWQFYELVMTQWPLKPSQPNLPGTTNNTFPGTGTDATSFSNTILETFQQTNVRTGCMNCHTQTMGPSDFLWTLADHAFPPTVPSLFLTDPSFRQLTNLMQIPVKRKTRKQSQARTHTGVNE
jgi:hypothetical protein